MLCSGALEGFGAVWTFSDPTEYAKSEEVGCGTSEPLDSLIGGVLANQHSVWEGRNTVCVLVFYAPRSVISCFMLWSTGMRQAVIMSVQDKLICVHLVMPRCMFSMQLFLSEIVKFRFDQKK